MSSHISGHSVSRFEVLSERHTHPVHFFHFQLLENPVP